MRENVLSWIKFVTNTLKWLIINWKMVVPIFLFIGSSTWFGLSMTDEPPPVKKCTCNLSDHILKEH